MTEDTDKRTMFVIYHNDADGQCAAAIAGRAALRDGFSNVRYLPVANGAAVPDLGAMGYSAVVDEVFLADFSFKADGMLKLSVMTGGRVTWIDHHYKTFVELTEFIGLPGVRRDGTAACLLTWQYLHPGMAPPWAARFIADRDVWEFKYGARTRFFYEGFIAQEDTHPESMLWDNLLIPAKEPPGKFTDIYGAATAYLLERGELLRASRINRLKFTARWLGRSTTLAVMGGGASNLYSVLLINYPGSGDLGEVAREMGYDLAWCYVQMPNDGTVLWKHSLYSRALDVGAVCKQMGGGGHKGAAGFTSDHFINFDDAAGIQICIGYDQNGKEAPNVDLG